MHTTVCSQLVIFCSVFLGAMAQRGNRYYPEMSPVKIQDPSTFVVRQTHPDCNTSQFRFYRSFDGECTHPGRPNVGRARTPVFSYYGETFDSRPLSGSGLPSTRAISNAIFHQFDESLVDPNNKLSEFVTFFGQFLDHNVVLTSNDMDNSFADQDIPVAADDPIYREDFIQFNRNIKANKRGVRNGPGWNRAINVLSSAVDLFGVYGSSTLAPNLRTGDGGMLKTSGGDANLLPLNGEGINSADAARNSPHTSPEERSNFFIAGDSRSNENPQLTAVHIVFLRLHNQIAQDLTLKFPGKSDEWYYQSARRVNQAFFQNVVFNEYLPSMTGSKLEECPTVDGQVQCFDENEDVGISDIFYVAAFRVGHTMVGNFIHRVGSGGSFLKPIELRDAFFPNTSFIQRDGIEPYLRGAVRNRAQKIDNFIVDALRNALYEGVPDEEGFDLAAINIQRGRDTNLPSLASVKKRFLGENIRRFQQITKDNALLRRLRKVYNNAKDVELWVGMLCEDHAPGKPMGPTIISVWLEEFKRLRNGDAYYYQNKNMYEPELLSYKPLLDTINGAGPTMRDLILRTTSITDDEIPKNIWKLD